MELRVHDDRPVLVTEGGHELDPSILSLGRQLEADLAEWAQIVGLLHRTGKYADAADVVSGRGRRLAARIATELREPVTYNDPVTRQASVVDVEHKRRSTAKGLFARSPDEPTPWGTGLTIAVILAGVVAVAVLSLTAAVAEETNGLLAAGAALIFTAGVAPSLWLGRQVPVLRWVCAGGAAGLAASWIGVLAVVL